LSKYLKYKDDPLVLNSSKLLPVSSNQRTNAYLKEIGDICGIKTVLTFHIARHSFATSVALPFGLKFETLSKVMGHTNLNMTLHYAKVLRQNLLVMWKTSKIISKKPLKHRGLAK
jgi:site-specific recombinase XerD